MEQTGTSVNNPTNANASFVLVDPRKRKKDMEVTEGTATLPKLDLRWEQTEGEVTIHAKIDAKDGDIDKVEVTFTDHQMTITLPEGQQQSWCFHGAIDKPQSRVSRSKQKFHMTVVKKEPGLWPSQEVLQSVPDSAASEQQQPQQQEEHQSGEDVPDMASPDTDLPDSLQELRTKEDEPVLNLDYIKHDYYEVEDTITIHLYVTNVNKDVVKVHFDKQSFTVKFQTGDQKLLGLHEGTSEETVFCWTVKTKGVVIPAGCTWKTRPKTIDLKLKKTSPLKWEGLEASMKKETTPAPKTSSWMPATQSTSTASTSKAGSSSVAFDEMAQMTDNRSGLDSSETPSSSPLTSASARSQKPMAKVHPLNTQVLTHDRHVGYTGMSNLGNTCYMNSVVQVLANTCELRDYFIQGHYKDHINSKTGGDLACCFAALLKTLWNGSHKYVAPSRLKEMVSHRDSPFQGYFQHDAQEFLTYLVNRLHEDVNRAKQPQNTLKEKKSEDEKQAEGDSTAKSNDREANGEHTDDGAGDGASKSSHAIAEEKWSAHKKREDSFLVDLLYGQFKTKITCPTCKEVSKTFEPFSMLPLALPRNKKTLIATFMWRDAQRKPIKYRIQLIKEPTVEHLTEQLSHRTGVHPKNMRVFEVRNSLFHRRFKASSDLSRMDLKDTIIVSEVLSADEAGEDVVEIEVIQRLLHPPYPVSCSSCKQECQNDKKLRRCTSCFKVGYCNQVCQRNHWVTHKHHCNKGPDPVGCPFILSLPRSHCTHSRIARLMETFARHSVDTFQPPVKADPVVTTTPPTPLPPPSTPTPSASAAAASTSTSPTPKLSGSGAAPGGSMLPPGGDLHLPSHPSASNLSSSSGSQSSGSLSSLDSISSCSSTATLTAETSHATFDVGHSGGEEEGEEEGKEVSREERGAGDFDSGLGSVSSYQSGSTSQASTSGAQGDWKQPVDPDKDWPASHTAERSAPGSSNVQSVAASLSADRSVSHFFIKPVDAEGRGKRVDRLEDKGDTALDMSTNKYLSLDWRNNENQPCYVLVQSKELEVEEDDSVKNPRHVSETLTLQQCLDMYFAPEILRDMNAWTCDKCKRKQEAPKQYFLWKLPHIFIVQLKRFTSFDFFSRKIDTKVDFPVRGLDLNPYKYHPDEAPALYDLYGVISHVGSSPLGGHYTCYARCVDSSSSFKNEVEWRLFDDWNVSSVSNEKSVVDQSAYVLFYRRRQLFVPPPVVQPIGAPGEEQEEKKDLIREKNEEESSKETEMEDRHSFVKRNGKWPKTDEAEDDQEEKQDPEKDDDSDQMISSEGGRLVIDMDDGPHGVSLGYTDMDAVD